MSLLPPSPLLDETIASGQPGHIADHETIHHVLNNLLGVDTWATMDAVAAPETGQRWIATDQLDAEYVYDGARWRLACLKPGEICPLEYGADPTGATSSRQAVLDCLTATETAIITGGPYGTGNAYADIVWMPGFYKIAGGDINITAGDDITMRAFGGGSNHTFLWEHAPFIVFVTGGFVTSTDVSHTVSLHGLALYSQSGTPLTVSGAAAPGDVSQCYFSGGGTGNPALAINEGFWGHFVDSSFGAPDTSTPAVTITSMTPGGVDYGWLFRFTRCRFNKNGVRWNIANTHATVVGAATVFDSCDTENFPANSALLHVRNTHATANTTFEAVEFRSCTHSDNGSPCDMLKVETIGTGTLTVGTATFINTPVGGSSYHVRHVNTGGGVPRTDRVFVVGSLPQVLMTTNSSNGAMGQSSGSGWYYVGDRALSTVLWSRADEDTQARHRLMADGWMWRYDTGTTDPFQKTGFLHGSGSPEGVVTAGIGSIYQRRDGGAGTSMYVKESGTGNTGWVGK